MADILSTIQQGLSFARQVSAVIPGASVATPFLAIGEKLTGILDVLIDQAPDPRTRDQIRAARAELAAAVSAKAERAADRFD